MGRMAAIFWCTAVLVVPFAEMAAAAGGGSVYRCESAAGVSFQDTACAGAARGDRLELAVAEAAPQPPAIAELVQQYEPRRRASAKASPRGGAGTSRAARDKPAYRCTRSDGVVEYLDTRCPKPRAAKGKPAPTVVEERITAVEACEGRHAALDPYEREKRGAPSCR